MHRDCPEKAQDSLYWHPGLLGAVLRGLRDPLKDRQPLPGAPNVEGLDRGGLGRVAECTRPAPSCLEGGEFGGLESELVAGGERVDTRTRGFEWFGPPERNTLRPLSVLYCLSWLGRPAASWRSLYRASSPPLILRGGDGTVGRTPTGGPGVKVIILNPPLASGTGTKSSWRAGVEISCACPVTFRQRAVVTEQACWPSGAGGAAST
jgi:hypothetical protein